MHLFVHIHLIVVFGKGPLTRHCEMILPLCTRVPLVFMGDHNGTVYITRSIDGSPRCFLLEGGNAVMYPDSVGIV